MSLLQKTPKDLMGPVEWGRLGLKMLPFLGPLARWGIVSAQEFSDRFKDPFLHLAVPQMFAWPSIPVMVGMSLLADIEFVDVATPLSYDRYTGNWQGSSCGWLLTKETMFMMLI